jgi:hypothetical protein
MHTFLAIDPSTTRLGWATYKAGIEGEDFAQLGSPAWAYGFHKPLGDCIQEKVYDVAKFFRQIGSISTLICEEPKFHGGGERGLIAAKEGYTIWLGMIVGAAIASFCLLPKNIYLYSPQQWKGAVPKAVTAKKFERVFLDANKHNVNHDEVDAIMILHYHLSRLYSRNPQ